MLIMELSHVTQKPFATLYHPASGDIEQEGDEVSHPKMIELYL